MNYIKIKDIELKKHEKYKYLSINSMPSKEELNEFYQKQYYQNQTGQYSNEYKDFELEYFSIDSKILDYLFHKTFPKASKKSFLDVGCGEGFQSDYFLKKKWRINCIDYSDFGILGQNPHLIDYFLKGEIDELLFSLFKRKKKYSLILLKNVLEHVICPITTLKSIKKLMNQDTLLSIEVPNDFSDFQQYLLRKNYTKNTWLCPPQHLHYFQFDSIKSLLIGEGFEIVSLQAAFPIEQLLINKFSNYSTNKDVGKEAHLTRCEVSSFLIGKGIEKYIKLRESYADLSFGRDIVATVRLK
jgi:2-polyprenyl-3-methyl-5-hydroxy-6-metoxy-1,4-benzoquinol methylase